MFAYFFSSGDSYTSDWPCSEKCGFVHSYTWYRIQPEREDIHYIDLAVKSNSAGKKNHTGPVKQNAPA